MEQMNEATEVILDGVKVSIQQLREKQCDPNIRVIQIKEGEYKTLARMQG